MRPLLPLIFTACAAAPHPVPPFGTERSFADAVAAPLAAAALLEGPGNRFGAEGRYRIDHAAACVSAKVGQGNPTVWPDRSLPPAAGHVMRVEWLIETVAPYGPPRAAALLVSQGPGVDRVPLEAFGMPGCVLAVDTAPDRLSAVFPTADGPLRQEGNRVMLAYVVPPALAGTELRLQLLVASPGANPGGWLLAPALVVWIGSGDTP